MDTPTKTIESRLREIIQNQLSVDAESITRAASFLDDLGADSLDVIELIMAVEDEFKDELGGEITEADAEKLTTFGATIDYIEKRAGQKP